MAQRLAAILTCCMIALPACTTHVYTARMEAEDAQGKEREVILYWTNTPRLFGEAKAGPAMLLTECGQPIQFDERPEGIVFRGTPGMDKLPDQTTGAAEFECGRFTTHERFTDIGEGRVPLTVRCVPVSDEFSAIKRNYIAAQPVPYEFDVVGEKHRGIFISHEDIVPRTPDCADW